LGISTPAGLVIKDEERSLVLEAAGDLALALHTIEGYGQRRQGPGARVACRLLKTRTFDAKP